jgi:hypothetical protein
MWKSLIHANEIINVLAHQISYVCYQHGCFVHRDINMLWVVKRSFLGRDEITGVKRDSLKYENYYRYIIEKQIIMTNDTHFVVILHELYNDPYVVRVVFDRNYPHYVRSIFGVRVLAVLVGQHQTGISLVDLKCYRTFYIGRLMLYTQRTATATKLPCFIAYNRIEL